jgi:hypothetical protein
MKYPTYYEYVEDSERTLHFRIVGDGTHPRVDEIYMLLAICCCSAFQPPKPPAMLRAKSVSEPLPSLYGSPANLLSLAPVSVLAAATPSWAQDSIEIIGNAATETDIGVRPTVLGVPLGLLYLAFRIYIQVGIQKQEGGAGMVLLNGTKTVDGKPVEQNTFMRSLSETIRAASEAKEDAGDGGDSKRKRGR